MKLPISLLSLSITPCLALAQAPLWNSGGSLATSLHGIRMTVINDYNGNGTADVMIGEPGDSGAGFVTQGGSVLIRDGDGSCITIFYGSGNTRRMGTAVASLPDVNGDGIDEILIGSAGRGPGFGLLNGRVSAYFGGRDGGGAAGCAGASYAAPDLLIDRGTSTAANPDFFGEEIQAIDDLDGDGVADFLVGATFGVDPSAPTGVNNLGYVQAFSGAGLLTGTETLLFTVRGQQDRGNFGQQIATLGDLTGDGVPEFCVSAPQEEAANEFANGTIRFYNGATQNVFLTLIGENGDLLGHALESAGDIDNDDILDLIVGSPWDRPATGARTGSVAVLRGSWLQNIAINGFTGAQPAPVGVAQVVFRAFGNDLYASSSLNNADDGLGWSVANVGDLDGDNVNDVLCGAVSANVWDPDWLSSTTPPVASTNWPNNFDAIATGTARLLSGATGNTIKQYFDPMGDAGDSFGQAVSGGGDFDGDGVNDIVIAAPRTDAPFTTDNGTVYAYSGLTEYGVVYANGLPNSTGSVATIAVTGSQSIGTNFAQLTSTNCPANTFGLFVLGSDQQLPGTPLFSGTLFLGGTLIRLPVIQTSATGVASSKLEFTPQLMNLGVLASTRWNVQFWFRDGGTANLSDAITVGFYQ
ncbi:MAG: hypothetical protein AB8H80_21915 [Planctomycetota bacterium]